MATSKQTGKAPKSTKKSTTNKRGEAELELLFAKALVRRKRKVLETIIEELHFSQLLLQAFLSSEKHIGKKESPETLKELKLSAEQLKDIAEGLVLILSQD